MGNAYGIDIGTSNFKMCCSDKDKILNEKNIIAIANKTEILAFGDEAYEMYEKAPEHIEVSFPVKFGVIADIENMQTLLFNFFNKINEGKKITGSDFYIAVPTDVTEVEKRAFYELVVDSKVPAADVVKTIKRASKQLVKSAEVFDVYEGEHMEEGKKSLAISLLFQDPSRTLDDATINSAMEKILEACKKDHNAVLRG